MNTEEVVDNQLEESITLKPIEGSNRAVWQWLFVQPPVGACPVGHAKPIVRRLTSALLRPRPDVFTRVVLARSDAYARAGCPEHLAEYAACRDLWNALICGKESITAEG